MENNRVLIDTSVLIDHIRKTKKTDTLLYRILESSISYVSEITAFEILVGKNKTNSEFLINLLQNIDHLPYDHFCKEKSVEIYMQLKAKSQLFPPSDIFIAATALAHKMPLTTFNVKHFDRIDGLEIIY